MDRAIKYNAQMEQRYEKSAFGGVDVWLIMGLAVFLVPLLGLAVGLQSGYIHGG